VNIVAATSGAHRASARERLLAAANELFYAEGIQTVGIDRIIERAGVAKASLYNLYGSKEELVAAYLGWHHDNTTSTLTEAIGRTDDPRQKILAVFDAQAQQFMRPDFNGCAIVAASTEAPAGGLVERAADNFRLWIREMFTDLAERAGARDPVDLGRQLQLLYDGAGLAARMDRQEPRIAGSARTAAQSVVEAALSAGRSSRRTQSRTGRATPRRAQSRGDRATPRRA
jgi:AcrR family transcriptional regulator